MAKKGKINHNEKRKKLVAKYAKKRAELMAIWQDPDADDEAKEAAFIKFQKIPRNASATRVRNRCRVTGRPRAYYRKFQMSRISLRDHGLAGEIAGLTKSSW